MMLMRCIAEVDTVRPHREQVDHGRAEELEPRLIDSFLKQCETAVEQHHDLDLWCCALPHCCSESRNRHEHEPIGKREVFPQKAVSLE